MTDATLIAADASLNSLVHNDPGEAQKEEEAQRQRRGTIDPEAQRKLSNQTHRSRTDPDATLAQKRGTPRQLKYKIHQTIDADSRVILDTEVTTGARHDNQPYLDQLQRIRDRCQITILEAIADRPGAFYRDLVGLKFLLKRIAPPLLQGPDRRDSGAPL
jgi:hypothetical protein